MLVQIKKPGSQKLNRIGFTLSPRLVLTIVMLTVLPDMYRFMYQENCNILRELLLPFF